MTKKIAILIPYYGKWPEFLPYFLNTLEYNYLLDVHFLTDLKPPQSAPLNTYFHKITFEQLKNKFESKLGIELTAFNPYKLCDFKPTYGFVFSEIIKDYEWWGFGDVDLVLGRLHIFLSEGMLESYDVISFREKWISGSLALFRNSPPINEMFMAINQWKELLCNDRHYGIDEVSGMHELVRKTDWDNIDWEIDNLTRVILELERKREIKINFQTRVKEYLHLEEFIEVGPKGCFDQSGKEFAYYHFVSEKKRYFFKLDIFNSSKMPYFFYCFGGGRSRSLREVRKQVRRLRIYKYPTFIVHHLDRAWKKLRL